MEWFFIWVLVGPVPLIVCKFLTLTYPSADAYVQRNGLLSCGMVFIGLAMPLIWWLVFVASLFSHRRGDTTGSMRAANKIVFLIGGGSVIALLVGVFLLVALSTG